MTTKTSNQEWVNITQLPMHTKREVIVGKIFDLIANRVEGFSINHNLQSPTWGYMVGTKWNVVHFDKNTTREEIERYVSKFLLNNDKYVFLGGWRSKEGVNYIEYSTQILSHSVAYKLAQKHGEISIWDVVAGQEIEINK